MESTGTTGRRVYMGHLERSNRDDVHSAHRAAISWWLLCILANEGMTSDKVAKNITVQGTQFIGLLGSNYSQVFPHTH